MVAAAGHRWKFLGVAFSRIASEEIVAGERNLGNRREQIPGKTREGRKNGAYYKFASNQVILVRTRSYF